MICRSECKDYTVAVAPGHGNSPPPYLEKRPFRSGTPTWSGTHFPPGWSVLENVAGRGKNQITNSREGGGVDFSVQELQSRDTVRTINNPYTRIGTDLQHEAVQ